MISTLDNVYSYFTNTPFLASMYICGGSNITYAYNDLLQYYTKPNYGYVININDDDIHGDITKS
jgi:hypothetical protein